MLTNVLAQLHALLNVHVNIGGELTLLETARDQASALVARGEQLERQSKRT